MKRHLVVVLQLAAEARHHEQYTTHETSHEQEKQPPYSHILKALVELRMPLHGVAGELQHSALGEVILAPYTNGVCHHKQCPQMTRQHQIWKQGRGGGREGERKVDLWYIEIKNSGNLIGARSSRATNY